MSEDNDISSSVLSQTVQEKIKQIVKGNSSLSKKHTKELETVLASAALRLKDKIQRISFLELVQRLQGYHIIQILNVVVVRFKTFEEEPSAFLEKANRLVDICLSFCYTSNVSQRLSFEYYMKALKFCFPRDLKVCLSTEILKGLLTLVRISQEGKFAELGEAKEETNSKLQIHGTKYLFSKLIKIFESRRNDDSLVEIVDQTIRYASVDAKIKSVQQHVTGQVVFQSEHMVSTVLLSNWMKLLELPNVSSGFALSLAKIDDPRCAEHFGSVLIQFRSLTYQSIIFFWLDVLEGMLRNGIEVNIPNDRERLKIFFDYFIAFCRSPIVTATSLKLLAATSVKNDILREVFDQFFPIDGGDVLQKAEAFDLAFQVLSLFPNGELYKRVLRLWRETFSNTPSYPILACLLAFIVDEANSDLARRILDFLEWLPFPLLSLIFFWRELLVCFIKLFPNTFQRRPEVLVFIHKAARLATLFPARHRQDYIRSAQRPTLTSLEWLSQQNSAEEVKTGMIWLLVCSRDRPMGFNKEFDTDVIKKLSLCPSLPFSTKKRVCNEVTDLASFVNDSERKYLIDFIEELTSSQSPESMDEILLEFLDFIKRFVDKQRIKNCIPIHILTQLSSLSKMSLSGTRKMKVMQLFKKSGKGCLSGTCILNILKYHQCTLKERTNEYFDVLFPIVVETLDERQDLCKQLEYSTLGCEFPNTDVLKVWTFVAAALIIGGYHNDEIDLHYCRYILLHVWGFDFPYEILELLSHVRSTAVRLAHLTRSRAEDQRISKNNPAEEPHLEMYYTIVTTVLGAEVLSPSEKILLVKKLGEVALRNPETLPDKNIEGALYNLLPFPRRQSNLSSTGVMHFDFRCIVSLVNDSKVLNQLSRIPRLGTTNGSLCWVLSTKMSESFSGRHLMNIFKVICSQQDLDQAFFQHLLPFIDVVLRESKSLEDVLEYVEQSLEVLRGIPSATIPLTMLNLHHLIENHVPKDERNQFLVEVGKRWKLTLDNVVLCFMDVSRVLWKAYNTASTPANRYQLIDRAESILRGNSSLEELAKNHPLLGFETQAERMIRRIARCELEWLVFHSSVSDEEAILAFQLSCRSLRMLSRRLRCFTFSDVRIEDGFFKFVSKENEITSDFHAKGIGTTLNITVTTQGNVHPAAEQKHPVPPVLIAIKIICHLKRLLGQKRDPSESAIALWKLVFDQPSSHCWEEGCASRSSFIDDYVDLILSILSEASSLEMVMHWTRMNQHHAIQCSEVILKACKWTGNGDDIDEAALFELQTLVSTTLEIRRKQTPATASVPLLGFVMSASCFRLLELQLKELSVILERRLPFEVTKSVLNLYEKNVQAAVAVWEIVSMWSCKQQSIELVKSMKSFCEGEEITPLSPAQCDFVWQLLKSFDHICMNSCQDLVTKLKELIVLYDPEDCYGFNRLPKWRQAMISDGFPARVINDWCVTFLMTPLEDLTSRDVDAIVDLNSRSLQLVASASQVIARIIFPKEGFEVKKGEGIKQGKMKERIRLARLLGEFINILRRRKPDENSKDAVVREIVLDACNELCRSHEDSSTTRNDLYKIHGLKLKSLFTEIFGKRRRGEDGKEIIQDSALTPPTCDEDPKVVKCIARQTSYLHENLPFVLSQKDVYEPMIVLLRRWLSAIVMKPVLASHTLDIVKTLFSEPPSDANSSFLDGLHRKIQARILSLEENQSLMAQFQAAGYNQEGADKLDLWSSPAVELPCYLTKRESPNKKLHTKKLTEVLQRLWNEWKDILFMCDVSFINVGGEEVCTKDLFGFKDSLKEMEEQVAAVKEKVKHVHLEHFRSEDLERRAERLIRLEQQYRKRIGKRYKTSINRTPEASEERKKFVAVWENRFLEQVKLCSEKIPGCYAPNGFHSEKPVICALSVDNKILTVFKEENGRRDELENVEVKLFEAGMYVYGLYTNGHDYVTDELWAAFYKMLLEKRLVPRIVLSNESPGFDWIKMKKYVEPCK
ncbi:uncharacterized protein LOC111342533 [Stylophora pistillata]|uniref:uncharacterized protein LOC111342533 n=1 Tax=Stylophora pistillata TaxID=50429 RepID=UPI000C041FD9|nr:uncharacterized protein LOC111342533 [Stylophora pistillata]